MNALDVPPLPRPPRARVLVLDLLVLVTRVLLVLVVPLTVVSALALVPFLRLKWDVRIPGLGTACWIFAAGVVWVCWRSRMEWTSRGEPRVWLDREHHPRLFELLDAIARTTETGPVDEVVMQWGQGFAVSQRRTPGLFGEIRRRLYFDYGNSCGYTLAELTSTLVHEFAHFRGGHTSHSARLYRQSRFLFNLRHFLSERGDRFINPVYWIVWLSEHTYRRLYGSISQEMERQADDLAIELVGPGAFEGGLRKEYLESIRRRSRFPSAIREATASDDPSPNLLAIMAELPPQIHSEEHALEEALEAPTRPGDTHPSGAARIAAARAARDRGVSDPAPWIRGGRDPYEFLLGEDLERYQQAVSAEVLGRRARWRTETPGLRAGLLSDEEIANANPRFGMPLHDRALSLGLLAMWGAGTALLFLVILFLALVVSFASRPIDPGFSLGIMTLAPLTLLALLVCLHLLRRLRSRIDLDRDGLHVRWPWSRRRFGWHDVQRVRVSESRCHVVVDDGSGRRQSIKVAGPRTQRAALVDMLLEYVPSLQVVGWGTGLSRVPEPSTVPRETVQVQRDGSVLEIVGPDSSEIRFFPSHPQFDEIEAYVRERLVPLASERHVE